MDPDFQVNTVESGIECLEYLNNNDPPDVILLDVMMPEMSGWETLDKIRDNTAWKNIPIVFLTGRTDRIAKNAGSFLAEDFIEKPAKINEIKKRIDEAIDKSKYK
jgi:two-component system chemotaxis sensor kinase CheA